MTKQFSRVWGPVRPLERRVTGVQRWQRHQKSGIYLKKGDFDFFYASMFVRDGRTNRLYRDVRTHRKRRNVIMSPVTTTRLTTRKGGKRLQWRLLQRNLSQLINGRACVRVSLRRSISPSVRNVSVRVHTRAFMTLHYAGQSREKKPRNMKLCDTSKNGTCP